MFTIAACGPEAVPNPNPPKEEAALSDGLLEVDIRMRYSMSLIRKAS